MKPNSILFVVLAAALTSGSAVAEKAPFPTLLREAGYTTAFYGKQHVIFEIGVNGMKTMFNDREVLHRNPFLKKMHDGSMRHVDDTPEKYTTNMRAYIRMMAGLDRIIGRVIDTLKEQGLHENTIIIEKYTSARGPVSSK